MATAKGRPLTLREEGSAKKLAQWFEDTGRPKAYVTSNYKPHKEGLRTQLPSRNTLKRWLIDGIPKDQIEIIAKVTDVPVSKWRSTESLQQFRAYVESRTPGSSLLPSRARLQTNALLEKIRLLSRDNDNAPRVLAAIYAANTPMNVDQIADEVQISVIQTREILEVFLGLDIIHIVNDSATSLRVGSALLSLTPLGVDCEPEIKILLSQRYGHV